jgi:hypothetical protein
LSNGPREKAIAEILYEKGHPSIVAAINRLTGEGRGGAGGGVTSLGGASFPAAVEPQIKVPKRTGGNWCDKVKCGFFILTNLKLVLKLQIA